MINPNNKDLEVSVSLSDWDYDSLGNNQVHEAGKLKTSCADWIQVLPGSFFTLRPNERRELDVVFTVPASANKEIPVHTALLFLTQMNPSDTKVANGTNIKVSVRMGVKLYHSFVQAEERNLEVSGFTDMTIASPGKPSIKALELKLLNTGKSWIEGKIKWEILNSRTGVKKVLGDSEFYSLPGDTRLIRQVLPPDLAKGDYTATAIINYGNKNELKIVELEFEQ